MFSGVHARQLRGATPAGNSYLSSKMWEGAFFDGFSCASSIRLEPSTWCSGYGPTLRFANTTAMATKFGVSTEQGEFFLCDSRRGSELSRWKIHDDAIFDFVWKDCDSKIVTASGDQSVCISDVRTREVTHRLKGHYGSVKSVCVSPNSNILASSSRDGSVRIYDCRCDPEKACVASLPKIHVIKKCIKPPVPSPPLTWGSSTPLPASGQGLRPSTPITTANLRNVGRQKPRWKTVKVNQCSVTGVAFGRNDVNTLLTAGAVDGLVKVWDIRRAGSKRPSPVQIYSDGQRHGVTSIDIDPSGTQLLVSYLHGPLRIFSLNNFFSEGSGRITGTYVGHDCSTFYVKARFGPFGKSILCGSGDECGYVWQCRIRPEPVIRTWTPSIGYCAESMSDDINKRKWIAPIGKFCGHMSEVTSVDFCRFDPGTFATIGEDRKCCIWKLGVNNRGSITAVENFYMVCLDGFGGTRKRKRTS